MTPRRRLLSRVAAWAPYVLLAIAIVLFAASGWARPGGGQSFGGRSGGGSGRSGGGSGGGGGGGGCVAAAELVWWLLELTIEHPAIGVPLDLVILGFIVYAYTQKHKQEAGWSTTAAAERAAYRVRPSRSIRRDLQLGVSRADPDFSLVLFEDFVYALFAAAHEARGKHQLDPLALYLRPAARQTLAGRGEGLAEVRTPVIGALRYVDLHLDAAIEGGGPGARGTIVTLEIEANYTEVPKGAPEGSPGRTFYVVERWTLSRAATARSRPPERASIIGCPNCGAPLSNVRGNRCNYCQQIVDTGAFDWMVESIDENDRMERPPQLTSDTEETGTDLPTVVAPDASFRLQAITRKDPAFSWPRFLNRVGLVFTELQPAWATREWARARPFVSDQLFQMLAYWIESYKREKLRNVTENARITAIELAAVTSDRYFDAITVRVRATGLDYTVTDAGITVSGSRSRERPYTEYWTLIRGTGTKTRDGDDRACPNCGAPLAINMAGSCTHCSAKVTSGEFDWVLSRIEQDEAYTG
jgi:hypothetical protein